MKIGDLVSVIDDDLKGKFCFQKFSANRRWTRFSLRDWKTKIVPQNLIFMMKFLWFLKRNFKNNFKKNQNRNLLIWHFENLVKNLKNMNLGKDWWFSEKLIEKLEYCRNNHFEKLNIIHGIGDGVLQNMVHWSITKVSQE